jgi:hypothetical protein
VLLAEWQPVAAGTAAKHGEAAMTEATLRVLLPSLPPVCDSVECGHTDRHAIAYLRCVLGKLHSREDGGFVGEGAPGVEGYERFRAHHSTAAAPTWSSKGVLLERAIILVSIPSRKRHDLTVIMDWCPQ